MGGHAFRHRGDLRAALVQCLPRFLERHHVGEIAEGVEIVFALGTPVAEMVTQLERAIGGTQELGLVDAKATAT